MTQINFTLDLDKLKDAVFESDMNEMMKTMLTLVLNEFMERERDLFVRASNHERSPMRTDYRNGYYEREMLLTPGRIVLKVPRTRSGEFATGVFEKYQRSQQSLLLSMMEMVVNGVSTRKVTKIMEELCGESVSKSTVSKLTQRLDPVVNEWARRPLNVKRFNYLFVDAMYIKVRENDRVVSKAVYLALGVDDQGKREILGLKIDHQESEDNWKAFFEDLKSRGIQSPKLVISDAHQGLRNAISKSFIGTSWQRCTVHMLRNITDTLPRKNSGDARSLLKSIFRASTKEEARRLKDQFITDYEDKKGYAEAIQILDEGFEDATQYYAEKQGNHVHLRTTNVIERLNVEIRRRERVIRIFPNHQSAFRLIGSVLMEYDETYDKGNKKFLNE